MSVPIVEWVRQQGSFNTQMNDYFPRIVLDTNGDIIVCYCSDNGYVTGQTHTGGIDIVIFKLSHTDGQCIWVTQQHSFNTEQDDLYPQIVVDQVGDIYICYCTEGSVSGYSTNGSWDIVVFKLAGQTGHCDWTTQNPLFNTNAGDVDPQIALDTLGNLCVCYVSGGTISNYISTSGHNYRGVSSVGGSNIVVFQLGCQDGVCHWVVQNPSFNSGDDLWPHLAIDQHGDIYICYHTISSVSGQTSSGGSDIVIFKLHGENGNCLWTAQQPTFNTSFNETGPKIALDQSGNAYIMYATTGTTSGQMLTGSQDVAVSKLDANTGLCLWVAQQPSFNADFTNGWYYNLVIDADNNVYAVYMAYSGAVSGQTQTGYFDEVVFKLNGLTGRCLWTAQQPTFNTDNNNTYQQIALDREGYVYVTYTADGTVSGQTDSGGFDIVVFKLDKNTGQCLWVIQNPLINTEHDDDLYFSIYQNNLQNMVIDTNGYVYIAYITYGTVSGQSSFGEGSDIVVCKLGQPVILFEYCQGVSTGNQPGSIVNYQYSIKNSGSTPINNLTVVDSLGMLVTLDQTNLAPNISTSGHATYYLTQDDVNRGFIDSSATVTGHYGESTVTDDQKTKVFLQPTPVTPLPPRHFHGKIRKCHHKNVMS